MVVYKAAMNIGMHMFSSNRYMGLELLDHGRVIFNILKNLYAVLHGAGPIYIPVSRI